MHEHNNCEHTLKLCRVCDVVYCERCKSQWRNNTYGYSYPYTPFIWYNTCGEHSGTAVSTDNVTNNPITISYKDNTPSPVCCGP